MDEVFHPGWRKALESAWIPGTTQATYRYTWSFRPDGGEGVVFWYEKIHARHGYRWVHPVHEVLEWMGPGQPGLKVSAEGVQLDHHPDPETPLEETMGALAQAVNSGKALYVGLSNYDGPTMEKAAAILAELHVPFIINQNKYNIFDRTVERNGLKDTAKHLGKGLITFCPLAQGLLTDRYLNGIPADSRVAHDPRFLHADDVTRVHGQIMALNEIAKQRGQTLAEMSLAWLLHDDAVTSVLAGASKPQQIIDNIGALKNTDFSDEELKAIDEISMQ